MNRPSPHKVMLMVAKLMSSRSTCSRLQVGAVVTDESMSTINSIGYNGGARGLSNECESPLPGQCGHIHAEINALLKADYSVKNKKIFTTHSPCKACSKAIINAGIAEVYFEEAYRDNNEPVELLTKAGVKVFQIDVLSDNVIHLNPDNSVRNALRYEMELAESRKRREESKS